MKIVDGITVFGDADDATIAQMRQVMRTGPVVAAALMADNHKGYSMPIGGVVVYKDAVSPSGVGYDIGCGIKAVKTNLNIHEIYEYRRALARRIATEVSFGVGRVAQERVDHALFDDPLWVEPEIAGLKDLAASQLGTVGSGNHFVDILSDEHDVLWVMAHFGSRGLGHKIASGFLNLAAGRSFGAKAPGENMDQAPTILDMHTDLGQYYWQAMHLAGRYAYAGRDAVVNQVLRILGAQEVFSVHNHHNFAWQEHYQSEQVIVVRKGATPAYQGQMGAVGGSMGDRSVILYGNNSEASLFSTVHGAGRIMSRTQAAGKVKWTRDAETGRKVPTRVTAGRISQDEMTAWLNDADVVLCGGGLDEAPQVYRRLEVVVEAQGNTIRPFMWLQPLVVVMAGGDVFDPYKD